MGLLREPFGYYVVAASELPVQEGRGGATKRVWFQNGEVGIGSAEPKIGTQFSIMLPRTESGLHDHRGMVEQFEIRGGEGHITIGDRSFELRTGMLIIVDAGVMHNLVAVTTLEMRIDTWRIVGSEEDKTPWLPSSQEQ